MQMALTRACSIAIVLGAFQLEGVKNTVALLVQLLHLTDPLMAAARNSTARPRDYVHSICLGPPLSTLRQ